MRVAGADEAGRGALFGRVYAAAVILDAERPIKGLADSKTLTAARREELALVIRNKALAWAVAWAEADEIDRINIYQASRLAIGRAVMELKPGPDYLLIDALKVDVDLPQESIIKGDAKVASIAAASILAKVGRDEWVAAAELEYPGYGLARHKGYATPEHQEALMRLGPTRLHRRSYAPVREAMQGRLG
ncbi:MAG TPA: ribonuclease HII [Bryobacteraceae bacterium]|nr:ribonuclease HII [Bryobacteraceae bacterium]